jgi:hypothetical protein
MDMFCQVFYNTEDTISCAKTYVYENVVGEVRSENSRRPSRSGRFNVVRKLDATYGRPERGDENNPNSYASTTQTITELLLG